MTIFIRIIQSLLGIWLMINIYRFSRAMAKENAEDAEGVKISLLLPLVLIILIYFGTAFAVGYIENPELIPIQHLLKKLIMLIQIIIIVIYPIAMSGELSTRMLGTEITESPGSEKRTRTLMTNVRVLVFLTFVISNVIYIIL